MTKISLQQFADVFAGMTNVETVDLGPGIAHRGEHPNHGETFLIQCDSHALMISEGVGLLPGPHGY